MTKGLLSGSWFTYIIECRDGSFYTGITNNLSERLSEHNAGEGSSWTRIRRPVKLCYAERHPHKSSARKREIEIKGWRREKKKALIKSDVALAGQAGRQRGRALIPRSTEGCYMPRLTKDEAIKTIQHRRSQMRAILKQNIPARDLGRKLRWEMDQAMLCCLLSDLELGMLSVEYLNDIIEHGWWSEVGRMRLRKLTERSEGSSPT